MAITLDGTTGITTPGLTNTGTETIVSLTTTGNTILGDASTDTLNVGNGGLCKDANGFVQIGTTTAATVNAVLTVYNPSANSSQIYLQNTGTGTGSTNGFRVLMGTTDVTMTNKENGPIVFETNDTERARIPAAGGIQSGNCVSVGNATPSASGAGITFPATQSASSDANTLDDYEEGSWTPASSFTGGNGTRTDTVTGKYTKIGDMVYANFDIAITKGTASGNLSVTGLPFARGGQDNRGGGVMFVYISMATLTNGLIAYIGDSQSSFTFFNGPALSNITAAGNLGTSSQFIGTVIYKV